MTAHPAHALPHTHTLTHTHTVRGRRQAEAGGRVLGKTYCVPPGGEDREDKSHAMTRSVTIKLSNMKNEPLQSKLSK